MCTINNDWTHFSVLNVMIHNRTVASQSFCCFLLYSQRGIRPNIQQLKLFPGFRCKSMQQKLQKQVFSSIPWFYRSIPRGDPPDSARRLRPIPRGDPLDAARRPARCCAATPPDAARRLRAVLATAYRSISLRCISRYVVAKYLLA